MNLKFFLPVAGFSLVLSGCSMISNEPLKTEGNMVLNHPTTDSNMGLIAPANKAPEPPVEPVRADYDSARALGAGVTPSSSITYQVDDPTRPVVAQVPANSRLKPAQERVIYYGPSKEGAAMLAPGREYLKVREASFDDMNLVEDAPPAIRIEQSPTGPAFGLRQARPAAEDPRVIDAFSGVAGRTNLSPVPMKRALSGSTRLIDGFFQPLGVGEDTLEGRRRAQDILEAHAELFRAHGELLYERGYGWGYFVSLETL